jgi:hypothetical protein
MSVAAPTNHSRAPIHLAFGWDFSIDSQPQVLNTWHIENHNLYEKFYGDLIKTFWRI